MNKTDFQIFATIKIPVTVNIRISPASESTQAWANSIFNHINSNLNSDNMWTSSTCWTRRRKGRNLSLKIKFQWLINHMFISLWRNTSNTKQFQPEHSMPNQILRWKEQTISASSYVQKSFKNWKNESICPLSMKTQSAGHQET